MLTVSITSINGDGWLSSPQATRAAPHYCIPLQLHTFDSTSNYAAAQTRFTPFITDCIWGFKDRIKVLKSCSSWTFQHLTARGISSQFNMGTKQELIEICFPVDVNCRKYHQQNIKQRQITAFRCEKAMYIQTAMMKTITSSTVLYISVPPSLQGKHHSLMK